MDSLEERAFERNEEVDESLSYPSDRAESSPYCRWCGRLDREIAYCPQYSCPKRDEPIQEDE